jgi:hypothetical protein
MVRRVWNMAAKRKTRRALASFKMRSMHKKLTLLDDSDRTKKYERNNKEKSKQLNMYSVP